MNEHVEIGLAILLYALGIALVLAQGTVGEVEADADTSIRVDALWQFAVTITFDDGRNRITAESSGEFFVEPDFPSQLNNFDIIDIIHSNQHNTLN